MNDDLDHTCSEPVSLSFSEQEVRWLEQTMRGLLARQDLRHFARAPEAISIARKIESQRKGASDA